MVGGRLQGKTVRRDREMSGIGVHEVKFTIHKKLKNNLRRGVFIWVENSLRRQKTMVF